MTQPTAADPVTQWNHSVITWGINTFILMLQCVGIYTHRHTHTKGYDEDNMTGEIEEGCHSLHMDSLIQVIKRECSPDILYPYRKTVYISAHVSILGISMCHHVLCLSDVLMHVYISVYVCLCVTWFLVECLFSSWRWDSVLSSACLSRVDALP